LCAQIIGWVFTLADRAWKLLSIIPFLSGINKLLGGIVGLIEATAIIGAIGAAGVGAGLAAAEALVRSSRAAALTVGGALGGGAIGALAVMTQTEVLLIIIGGIFVIEALSVAIQVFSFKAFRRRVLLMAPLHHHFEMMAWSETKIMLRFWIVAAVCSGIGFTLYQQSIGR